MNGPLPDAYFLIMLYGLRECTHTYVHAYTQLYYVAQYLRGGITGTGPTGMEGM